MYPPMLTHHNTSINSIQTMSKIIVTGASRGIGYETVLALAANPGQRILALARDYQKLVELQQQARHRYPDSEVLVYAMDLEQPISADFEEVIDTLLGGVDIVIHNAGLLIHKPFETLDQSDWTRIFGANVFGVAQLSKALFPWLKQSEHAHIVHIGSMGGFQGSSKFPGLSAYSASKAALACLTECLAEEWKSHHIAVNCLALGAVQTEMLAEAFPGYQAPLSSVEMGAYVAEFALGGHRLFNGKVLPVSVSTP